MSFPVYRDYKESGVPWLRAIPAHWEVRRLKTLFNLMKRPPMEDDGIVTAFRDGEVTLRSNRRVEGFTNAAQEIGYQGIRKGDLVIHAMDAFAGAIGVSDSNGKSTPVYSVCMPVDSDVDSWYYGQTLRHMALSGFVNSLAKGIRERSTEFRWADASIVELPAPPIEEQLAITRFIVNETAKIDALVAEQEQLITLLKEKRQAVISHAVTKGLDPSVPMKDSGVEWLGEVPEHWQVVRLKHVTKSIVDCPHETPVYSDDGKYLVIRTADLRDGTLDQSNMYRVDADEYQHRIRRMALMEDDIVYSREGERWGHAALIPESGKLCLGQRMMHFRAADDTNPAFLMWQLNSDATYRQGQVDTVGATSPHVNVGTIRNFALAQPPQTEQAEIVAWVQEQADEFDDLIDRATDAVQLLMERRSALISAAVTGQIDVRGLTPAQEQAACPPPPRPSRSTCPVAQLSRND